MAMWWWVAIGRERVENLDRATLRGLATGATPPGSGH